MKQSDCSNPVFSPTLESSSQGALAHPIQSPAPNLCLQKLCIVQKGPYFRIHRGQPPKQSSCEQVSCYLLMFGICPAPLYRPFKTWFFLKMIIVFFIYFLILRPDIHIFRSANTNDRSLKRPKARNFSTWCKQSYPNACNSGTGASHLL